MSTVANGVSGTCPAALVLRARYLLHIEVDIHSDCKRLRLKPYVVVSYACMRRYLLTADNVTPASVPVCVADRKFTISRPSGTAPPAEYAKLRKQCPLSQVRLWDDSKMWMVVRHKDVCDVLHDPRFSKMPRPLARAVALLRLCCVNRHLYTICATVLPTDSSVRCAAHFLHLHRLLGCCHSYQNLQDDAHDTWHSPYMVYTGVL